MARNTVNFTVTKDGRDKGKVFVITEMPAAQSEGWAMRAILALANEDVNIPEGFEHTGMAGMVELGIRSLSKLNWETAKPLLDEMWSCVQIMPDPSKPHLVRALIDQDVEELITRIDIRAEVFKLHGDFLTAVAPWLSGAAAGMARS